MEMESTRTKKTSLSLLGINTVRFLFKQETVQATKYLNYYKIPFQIMRSGEGYWLNVTFPCGITAPLSYQELYQLPEYKLN